MLDQIRSRFGGASKILSDASDVLGRDLVAHYAQDRDCYATNRDIQVALFLTSYLHAQWLASEGIVPKLSLGLSLGEYNHLVDIGAIQFVDALRLVDIRGCLYDRGPSGMMAAVAPIALSDLSRIMDEVAYLGVADIANFNSPTQYVISGLREPVMAALDALEEDLYVQGIVIEDSIPMHSRAFAPVAGALRPYLDSADWLQPVRPYIANVVGRIVSDPNPATIAELLERHVYSPVLWSRSLEEVAEQHPAAVFVEVGPRSVLCNIIGRRWLANRKLKTDCGGEDITEMLRELSMLSASE